MTTKKLKPVWRQNIGGGVPRDYGGVAYTLSSYEHGRLDTYKRNATDDELWRLDGGEIDIIYYQTTRTREAKFKMVACECIQQLAKCKISENLLCFKCNGRREVRRLIK